MIKSWTSPAPLAKEDANLCRYRQQRTNFVFLRTALEAENRVYP